LLQSEIDELEAGSVALVAARGTSAATARWHHYRGWP